jgi:hypothetical protein
MRRSGIKTLRDPRHGKLRAETVRRAHAAGGWQEAQRLLRERRREEPRR